MRIFFLIAAILCGLYARPQQQPNQQLDSMLHLLPDAKEDTIKVKLLNEIAGKYMAIDPKEGFSYANEGLDLAQKLQWKRGIANLNNCLGLLTYDTGNLTASRNYYEKSLDINQNLNATTSIIINMNNIGRSYQQEGNFTKASEYYFKAMSVAEDAGDNEQAALLGTNITSLFVIQKDYKKATAYAEKTIKYGKAAHVLIHVSKAYELLGVIDLETGDTIAAKKSLDSALIIDEKLDNQMAIVGVLTNLGTAETDPAKAIEIFLKAQKILDDMAPASLNSITNLANLGSYYQLLADTKSGEERRKNLNYAQLYLGRADSLCKVSNNVEMQGDIKQALADLQEDKGDYKSALQNYKAYVAINDSIFSQENKNKIAALESQRAMDVKNKQIENEQLQIANQRKKMWLLGGGVAFFLVIGIILYRQSVIRKKTNTTLLHLNNELDEANKVKAKFFGILSHDLRSPIANLINFLQLQKNKPGILTEEKKVAHENKISDSAKSLLETMEAMLLWSKGQMEHFRPTITSIPVAGLFSYLQQFFSNTENVSISFQDNSSLVVNTDKHYLQTIMQNLTANAINALKNTPDATIVWKAWQEQDNIYFSITDNGPGASNEQLKALYNDTVVSGSKHGLGLHIIRDLASAIGCAIRLQPKMQQGTQFVLSIPC